MRCPSCRSDETIPSVSGNPSSPSWTAAMLGLVHCGGIGDQKDWHCKNCNKSFEAEDDAAYIAAIGAAIKTAESSDAVWLKRPDAMHVSIGRNVFDLMLRQFRVIGAQGVRFTRAGRFEAINENTYEPVDWPLGEEYVPHMFDAIAVGACERVNQIQHRLTVSDDTIEITYLD